MSKAKQPPKLTRSQQWTRNSQRRRQALKEGGGGQFFALLDGDYMRKVDECMEWRNKAWRQTTGRDITKTDLLKIMVDADHSQIKRRQRATARRSGRDDDLPTAPDAREGAHP